eukprot:scaffold16_cov242-Pinguiococcus_pyrenoidosus.AAC.12
MPVKDVHDPSLGSAFCSLGSRSRSPASTSLPPSGSWGSDEFRPLTKSSRLSSCGSLPSGRPPPSTYSKGAPFGGMYAASSSWKFAPRILIRALVCGAMRTPTTRHAEERQYLSFEAPDGDALHVANDQDLRVGSVRVQVGENVLGQEHEVVRQVDGRQSGRREPSGVDVPEALIANHVALPAAPMQEVRKQPLDLVKGRSRSGQDAVQLVLLSPQLRRGEALRRSLQISALRQQEPLGHHRGLSAGSRRLQPRLLRLLRKLRLL